MDNQKLSRRSFLKISGGTLAASVLAANMGGFLSACSSAGGGSQKVSSGSFNWMTWSDHYIPGQLDKISTDYGIKANPSLFSDNSEALLKVQQVGGKQIDMVSGDAFWVPEYYKNGLIEPFDIESLDSAKDLFPEAKTLPFWKVDKGYLAFPFGWAPIQITYNPKYVTPDPDSWQVLWDPKYKGRLTMELQPFDVMAFMAKSLNFKDPYNMSTDELKQAKERLIALKPNILKFVEQSVEEVKLFTDESIWLCVSTLGMVDRVKAAGGPEIKAFIPKEGTVGFIDGEMVVKDAANRDVALSFLSKAETSEWLGKNFLEYNRPLLHKGAYDWLVKNGYEDRAKNALFNQPELATQMTLKGPSKTMDAYIAAFNEAIA